MADLIVLHQALIREVINGYAMILLLTLNLMISVFMWDTFVDWTSKNTSTRRRSWQDVPGIQTACALWWIFIAEAYRTGAVWSLYQAGKRANDASVFFSSGSYWASYGYLCAGIVLNGGLLRAIYIFTPPEWQNRVWVFAAIGAAMFVVAPSIFFNLKDTFNGI